MIPSRGGYISQLVFTLCWFTTITIAITGGILWKHLSNDTTTTSRDEAISLDHFSFLPQQQNAANTDDVCQREYERVNRRRTRGLTEEDLEHSRALMGNRYRLSVLAESLRQRHRPVTAVVCGGSISLGHGLANSTTMRYSHKLQEWLNANYPLPTTNSNAARHRVLNRGSHGADMCAMAKRVNILLQDLKKTTPSTSSHPDLFILEFAVNDYQGQDFKKHLIHQTDVFFDGFQTLALCAEVVVHKLLTTYPKTAVMFLEMQTAITPRKTAALLHMGVAKHYQVPVISYAETMFPDYYRLKHYLRQYDYSTATTIPGATTTFPGSQTATATADPVLPYPHGCVPCIHDNILDAFRDKGCKSLCIFADRSGEKGLDCANPPAGREPCYVSFLAHDAVHPSAVGHDIATDLIAHAISATARDICRGRQYVDHILPTDVGFLVANPNATLPHYSDFVLVQDTMEIFSKQDPLQAKTHSRGFQLDGDFINRPGWIATNPQGGEYVTFTIDLPLSPCYAVYLAILKSYENMGTMNVTVLDLETKRQTTTHLDGLWEPHISVPSDVQITADDPVSPGCTGKCTVTITTNAALKERQGNKVKIITLSARKCMENS